MITIAVDFDGTIVTHEYPQVGSPVPGAVAALHQLSARSDVRLILYTMRSGQTLQDAIDFCEAAGIKLWAVNSNPEQASWTVSRKVYANTYVDDAALGCPLIYPQDGSRPYVSWPAVMLLLGLRFGIHT